ncbi:Glutamate receptor ionotropic, kainate 2 [Halotydeus destructor]|nr:Glutamate receptor ionotropic, kainate 2 [Halotydeus destructor]
MYHFGVVSTIVISAVLIHHTNGLPNTIKIGGLFSAHEEQQELVFRFAVDGINSDTTILPRSTLIPQIERIGNDDSFHADKKVCGLLRNGVAAIFGPLGGATSMHVQSICDALEIPHVETRWDFQLHRDDLSINLYPRPAILARAYTDLVKAWGWRHFAIVYEDNEGVMRLQDFFKEAQIKDWKVTLYQFEPHQPYRDTFWKIKETREINIVLDVKPDNIHRVLKHAQQVGMMTELHSYLITSLDLHTVDLEDFKFGKTRISSYRLVDTASPELLSLMAEWSTLATRLGKRTSLTQPPEHIKTETALIYDAVKLLATALQDLDQSQSIDVTPISCENGTPWPHGSSLINYMRPISFRGITGLVSFDQLGFRSSFNFDVMTISETGLQKIGTWNEEKDLNISEDWMRHYVSLAIKNKTLIVTTVLNEPYTMLRETADRKSGNEQFEGFGVDLVEELSKILHFKYKFQLVKDKSYGVKNDKNEWNGMIGEVMRGEADMAIADLTITSKREEAVDFTLPFMNTGISILFKKPTTKVTTLFSFLSPFSMVVWVYVVGAYVGVSVILFVVGRLSPYEWDNPHPCRQDDQVLENDFSLLNSFWFTIGSLMQQGSDLAPKSMSTRTIAGIWYFFTLIMISSYTANLAAFLTVEKVVFPIESAEDLAGQTEIEYGCVGSGSTRSFFQESSIPTYKKMWSYMQANSQAFVPSNKAGKLRVAKGNYAFLMESASIEYIIERNCNLTQIGSLLDSKGYGIATRKDSPYRTPLSQAILQLQESGMLHSLKDRWWKQKRGGGACADDSKKGSTVNELSLGNVGGVFVVLLGGFAFSLIVALCEFMWRARKLAPDKKSMCEEMLRDIKFALSCQSSTKAVRRRSDFISAVSPTDEKSGQLPAFSAIY